MDGHIARFRRQPRLWLDDERWSAEAGLYEDVLELTCLACGDTLGPLDAQTPKIKALRGPYSTATDAAAAAEQHRRESLD
jgi:hypothetical protein